MSFLNKKKGEKTHEGNPGHRVHATHSELSSKQMKQKLAYYTNLGAIRSYDYRDG
jgi:hypothetical protein